MKNLPSDVVEYKRTPEFSELSVPVALLSRHSTKEGTWGKIVVLQGTLIYRILEPDAEEWELDPRHPGVIEPAIGHEIEIPAAASFYVQFYRKPGAVG